MTDYAGNKDKRCITDDLICPITLELPIDPVTAEDGRVYERAAIERHFQSKQEIKSPLTNAPMDKRLLGAPQTRNTIEILIEKGVIAGDLADKWKQRTKQNKEMSDVVKKAEAGDVRSIEVLAWYYHLGEAGFERNATLAYPLFKKAHDAGSFTATAAIGEMCCKGLGRPRNRSLGLAYLGIAATETNLAAYELGMAFAKGRYGLPVDPSQARRLLELVLSRKCRHNNELKDDCVQLAQETLETLKAPRSAHA